MKAFSRYFMWQILNIFLVTSIAGSVFDTLALILDSPETGFELLGNSLPRMSSFFWYVLFRSRPSETSVELTTSSCQRIRHNKDVHRIRGRDIEDSQHHPSITAAALLSQFYSESQEEYQAGYEGNRRSGMVQLPQDPGARYACGCHKRRLRCRSPDRPHPVRNLLLFEPDRMDSSVSIRLRVGLRNWR